LARYDKLHLVPFGEYIPLKKIFSFLQTIVPIGEIQGGRECTVFTLPVTESRTQSLRLAALICFEDLFPELSRRFAQRSAQVLVNITNDAWYKDTSAPYQHLQASVFRAVENRLHLARCANTGVSGFITPKGKITALIKDESGKNTFIDGFLTEELLILQSRPTFYNRHGDTFLIVCLLIVFYGIITPRKIKR
jgi:apolipoprotein N-acyltransferase